MVVKQEISTLHTVQSQKPQTELEIRLSKTSIYSKIRE